MHDRHLVERIAVIGCAFAMGMSAIPVATARSIQVGSRDYPTLQAALAAVPDLRAGLRPAESIEVILPPGVTRLEAPLTIGADLAGSAEAPLIVRGAADGTSRVSGARLVSARPARPADAPGIRLPRGTVAIEMGGLPAGSAPIDGRSPHAPTPATSLQLFQGATWLQPARWPKSGTWAGAATGDNAAGPRIALPAASIAPLKDEPALWATGYWGADWEYERGKVITVGAAGIQLAPLRAMQPIRPIVRFRLENAVHGLAPGHFVWLPARGVVLALPDGKAAFEATVAPTLLRIEKTRNVTIRNITFERSGGDAVKIEHGRNIVMENCRITETGGNGIFVSGGADVVVRHTTVTRTGERGVTLGGGSRATLTPANHAFENGIVTDFGRIEPSYRPGVDLWGVGNRLSGSLIAGGDHAGVIVGGNDHVVVDNEIRDVLRDTEDGGAVYMGADWTQRGNRVIGNYIHRLGTPGKATTFLVGVYLDDQIGGERIADNVIVGGEFGVVIGGGRDNVVTGNLFAYPRRAGVHVDSRGEDKQKHRLGEFVRKLDGMPVASAVWKRRYPMLADLAPSLYGVTGGNVLLGNTLLRGVNSSVPLLAGPASGQRGIAAHDNAARTPNTEAGQGPGAVRDLSDTPGRACIVRDRTVPAKDECAWRGAGGAMAGQ